jgi:endonuclease/exonuclease/phosphatase family metal-dependent hydrolase
MTRARRQVRQVNELLRMLPAASAVIVVGDFNAQAGGDDRFSDRL